MPAKTKHYLDALDPFASRFIRAKVRQLMLLPGFRSSDREDLLHDFAVDLLQRRASFDPATGAWEAFVVVVCENRCASILAHRCAEMRSRDREWGSLNDVARDEEGHRVEAGARLADDCHERRTGGHARRWDETVDLKHDLADVLDSLPPRLRELCRRLQTDSVSQAARAMGMSRAAAYERLHRLRRRFEQAGLHWYFRSFPTTRASER